QLLGSQGHPHDLAVCTGDATGLAARIPPGPPAGGSTPSHPPTLTPPPHHPCRSSGNPPGTGSYTSSPGDVSPPARSSPSPAQAATPGSTTPRRRLTTGADRITRKTRKY